MRVLLCHSFYQQQGGEDRSFAHERDLLARHGHDVFTYTKDNRSLDQVGRVTAAVKTTWNAEVHREVRALLRQRRPDVMHCTNTFPLVSPAVYYAARAEGVPVVQSLRNYRIACVRGDFHRAGAICEACKGRLVAWSGLRYRCYRDSLTASAAVASMQAIHRVLGTWTRRVDRYVALTKGSRRRFVECGLPAEKIRILPNFLLEDPGPGPGDGNYAVFVGRLSKEKGVDVLLDAWRGVGSRLPLKILGDGPLAPVVRSATLPGAIEWIGRQPEEVVLRVVGRARVMIMTSTCFENFPRTILESLAKGTPVIASRLGAMAEILEERKTGLLFEMGRPIDLVARVMEFMGLSERMVQEMRTTCRSTFERHYTAEAGYGRLLRLYREVTGSNVDGQRTT